ncbi:Outer membrane protein W [Methylobacterium brachiatum]|nr:Outer membrane protein W [Methylobacterium brachiatum]
MRQKTVLLAATAAVLASGCAGTRAADLPTFAAAPAPEPVLATWSPWMLRVRALGVLPDPRARLSAGGAPITGAGVAITDSAIPELDISYFFTKNIAAELILGVTRHGIQGAGTLAGTRIGSTWILPPTLTLQYHFDGFGPLKPYVGAGVNYSIFFDERERGGFTGFRLSNSFAPALQAGFDYMLDAHWGLNVDVKKLFLDTKVKLNAGAIRGRVDIDPWIVGAGITYRF